MPPTEHWFRSHHGAPTDAKFLAIGRRTGAAPAAVAWLWWAVMDRASQATPRGSCAGLDVEALAAFGGLEEEDAHAVVAEFTRRGMIGPDGMLAAWEKRQPKREDDSRERVRAHRERQKQGGNETQAPPPVTHGNAPVTQRNARGEERRVEESKGTTDADAKASEPQAAQTAAPDNVIPLPAADRQAQNDAAGLIREHLWLGDTPPPDTDMGRELNVWNQLAKQHGAAQVNGALTVCRKALRLTDGPISIRVLYPKGRRDRLNDAIRWWRAEQDRRDADPTRAGNVLGALLGGGRG